MSGSSNEINYLLADSSSEQDSSRENEQESSPQGESGSEDESVNEGPDIITTGGESGFESEAEDSSDQLPLDDESGDSWSGRLPPDMIEDMMNDVNVLNHIFSLRVPEAGDEVDRETASQSSLSAASGNVPEPDEDGNTDSDATVIYWQEPQNSNCVSVSPSSPGSD